METPNHNINSNNCNKSKISLHDLQKWMRWVIVDPRGVKKALKNPHPVHTSHPKRYVAPNVSAYSFFDNSNKVNVKERLSVYAEGYFLRIAEVLGNDFSVTQKVLDAELFLELVCDYLKEYPSRTPNISEVASMLPVFVKTHRFAKRKSYLADLVNLEWSVVESIYANSLPTMNFDALSEISEEQWTQAKIKVDPSLKLLNCNWPVHELWHSFMDENENFHLIEKSMQKQNVLLAIYRFDRIFVESLTQVEHEILTLMQNDCTLGTIMNEVEVESAHLTHCFAKWTQCGIIKSVEF